jgi:hypothetical protein
MIKTFFHRAALLVATTAVVGMVSSCKPESTVTDENAQLKQNLIDTYLNSVISPTYTSLANASQTLYEQLTNLRNNPTQTQLNAACETFLSARSYWEKSEAFLFGPAGDFGIDPHIDSWPLDEAAFNNTMSNQAQLADLDGEEGDQYAATYIGEGALGFHAVEYILFAEGAPKNIADISENELIYVKAVAGDLRNRCFQLEVSWLGDQAATEHVALMDSLEFNITVNGSDNSYGQNMSNAGNPGSTYASLTQAVMQIVSGCLDITDEVGTKKIGMPYFGEDINYIESPYSRTSITDFYGNIISVQNAYFGGIEGNRHESVSLHALISKLNPQVDAEITANITAALEAINNMKAPFALNYSDASCKSAIDALSTLTESLETAYDVLRNE